MDFVQGFDRNQLHVMSYEENVAQDSWARIVDLFVDILPFSELGFDAVIAEEGRPPYAAADMLKLFLYGYRSGLRSSRKLQHACRDSLEVRWLMKGLTPSARKIAYFRKDNARAFKAAFRHFVAMLKDMDLIEGSTIAIDSFKIRAQNSLKNNFNQKKIDRHIDYIDNKIEEYEQALDQADDEDQQQVIKEKIDYQKSKHDNYKQIEGQLHDSGQSQISLNDPDARAVILHRNITNVGYCVQAGCDSKHKLFVNNDTGSVNDTRPWHPWPSMPRTYWVWKPWTCSQTRDTPPANRYMNAPITRLPPTARPRRAPSKKTISSPSAGSPMIPPLTPTPAPTTRCSRALETSTTKIIT